MDEQIASVIWGELKRYINTVDRADAAESLISILIDNDVDPDDIRGAFKGDSDIKSALTNYLGTTKDEEEIDEDWEEEDLDTEDWEN